MSRSNAHFSRRLTGREVRHGDYRQLRRAFLRDAFEYLWSSADEEGAQVDWASTMFVTDTNTMGGLVWSVAVDVEYR